MFKSCYYCGFKIENHKPVCPKCNTRTKWLTKEQCIQIAIQSENKRWENLTKHNNKIIQSTNHTHDYCVNNSITGKVHCIVCGEIQAD